ncbi:MAG: CBS domain-containing protein [Phyllobacteriaceae bacterium]|nr:CBS domain-containing protein [Phyllobacteriaceae bacterium]
MIGWSVAAVLFVALAGAIAYRGRLDGWIERLGGADDNQSATEELRDAVEEMHRGGQVVKTDRDRFGGLLDLSELEIADVMVHRTAMRMIDANEKPETVLREVLASSHTRLPVYRETADNIVGILHARDFVRAYHEAGAAPLDVTAIASKPWFVPETTNLSEQLNAFLRRKAHLAIAVDEYGEVKGLVTLEDILEEIVGDIADEHDAELPGIRRQGDGSYIVDGSTPIRDLNRALDWELPDEEATTVAGLVIHEARMIPEEKQAFTFHGKRFTVLKRERNRILRLKVKPVS